MNLPGQRNAHVGAWQQFISSETAPGVLLFVAAILAMVVANSTLAPFYRTFLEIPIVLSVGAFVIDKPLLLWVNDGLMAVFFFLVGLELKRELLEGELSDPRQALLPVAAAIGGIAIPSLIYAAINAGDDFAHRGWAIPAATDIAFALGVLALLGDRVPRGLKVFLLTVAIVDDIGAIIIIAVFYSATPSAVTLYVAGAAMLALLVMNRLGVLRIAPYILIGLVLWGDGLRLVVCLPLFAFANAGVSFAGMALADLVHPITTGIALGLFLGKQAGIMAVSGALILVGWARLPKGATWGSFYGVAVLTGIGFTMSLFIGSLAFEPGSLGEGVDERVGILLGSAGSALREICAIADPRALHLPSRAMPA